MNAARSRLKASFHQLRHAAGTGCQRHYLNGPSRHSAGGERRGDCLGTGETESDRLLLRGRIGRASVPMSERLDHMVPAFGGQCFQCRQGGRRDRRRSGGKRDHDGRCRVGSRRGRGGQGRRRAGRHRRHSGRWCAGRRHGFGPRGGVRHTRVGSSAPRRGWHATRRRGQSRGWRRRGRDRRERANLTRWYLRRGRYVRERSTLNRADGRLLRRRRGSGDSRRNRGRSGGRRRWSG